MGHRQKKQHVRMCESEGEWNVRLTQSVEWHKERIGR